jgi:hypothetical protein
MNLLGDTDDSSSNCIGSGHNAASLALDLLTGTTPDLPVQLQVARRQSPSKKQRDVNISSFIWDPKAKSTQTVQHTYFEVGRTRFNARNTLEDELSRLQFKKKIMARLDTQCVSSLGEAVCQRLSLHTSVTIRNGNALWGRWLMHSVNPVDPSSIDTWTPEDAVGPLVDELVSAGAPLVDAQSVAASFTKFVTKMLRQRRVSKARGSCDGVGGKAASKRWEHGPTMERAVSALDSQTTTRLATKGDDDDAAVAALVGAIDTANHPHSQKKKTNKSRLTFVYMGERAEINAEHLDKLAELYRRHQGCPHPHDILVNGLDKEFNSHVMALLLRCKSKYRSSSFVLLSNFDCSACLSMTAS